MKIIEVTIDSLGRPKIEASGFVGGECVTKSKPILDALHDPAGKVVMEDKPEMYHTEAQELHLGI